MRTLLNRIARMFLLACSLVGTLACPERVNAAVIYDEAVSGDMDFFDTGKLALAAGINSILGSSWYMGESGDFDAFQFSLAAGMKLTGMNYIVSHLNALPGTTELKAGFTGNPGTHFGPVSYFQTVDIYKYLAPVSLFDSSMPLLGQGDFSFRTIFLAKNGEGGKWNYEIQLIVGEVKQLPEPAAIALIGLGLAGLVFMRRKKTSAR